MYYNQCVRLCQMLVKYLAHGALYKQLWCCSGYAKEKRKRKWKKKNGSRKQAG